MIFASPTGPFASGDYSSAFILLHIQSSTYCIQRTTHTAHRTHTQTYRCIHPPTSEYALNTACPEWVPLDLGQLGRRLGRGDGAAVRVLRRVDCSHGDVLDLADLGGNLLHAPQELIPLDRRLQVEEELDGSVLFYGLAAAPGHRIQPHGDSSDEEEGSDNLDEDLDLA